MQTERASSLLDGCLHFSKAWRRENAVNTQSISSLHQPSLHAENTISLEIQRVSRTSKPATFLECCPSPIRPRAPSNSYISHLTNSTFAQIRTNSSPHHPYSPDPFSQPVHISHSTAAPKSFHRPYSPRSAAHYRPISPLRSPLQDFPRDRIQLYKSTPRE